MKLSKDDFRSIDSFTFPPLEGGFKGMLPHKIKFLGHDYEVIEVTSNDIEGHNGETWLKKGLIKIDKDLPQSRKESVLLHEIIECIDSHFQLELPHNKIETLEECLYAVLKDNGLINFKGE